MFPPGANLKSTTSMIVFIYPERKISDSIAVRRIDHLVTMIAVEMSESE